MWGVSTWCIPCSWKLFSLQETKNSVPCKLKLSLVVQKCVPPFILKCVHRVGNPMCLWALPALYAGSVGSSRLPYCSCGRAQRRTAKQGAKPAGCAGALSAPDREEELLRGSALETWQLFSTRVAKKNCSSSNLPFKSCGWIVSSFSPKAFSVSGPARQCLLMGNPLALLVHLCLEWNPLLAWNALPCESFSRSNTAGKSFWFSKTCRILFISVDDSEKWDKIVVRLDGL